VTGSHFFEIDTHGVLPSFPKHISAFIDVWLWWGSGQRVVEYQHPKRVWSTIRSIWWSTRWISILSFWSCVADKSLFVWNCQSARSAIILSIFVWNEASNRKVRSPHTPRNTEHCYSKICLVFCYNKPVYANEHIWERGQNWLRFSSQRANLEIEILLEKILRDRFISLMENLETWGSVYNCVRRQIRKVRETYGDEILLVENVASPFMTIPKLSSFLCPLTFGSEHAMFANIYIYLKASLYSSVCDRNVGICDSFAVSSRHCRTSRSRSPVWMMIVSSRPSLANIWRIAYSCISGLFSIWRWWRAPVMEWLT
jgi:hypothetical protein